MAADISSEDNKMISAERAAFHADFELAAAVGDAECLTPEEILSLQAGRELDPLANEHLKRCALCSALKAAILVDPVRMQEFRRAVLRTQPPDAMEVPADGNRLRAKSNWRLPASAAAALASLALLIWTTQYRVLPQAYKNIVMARVTKPPMPPENRVRIALQPPSGPALQFVSTAPTTVKDVAPQVATEAVLSQSAITLPANAPPQLSAEVKKEASDIVYSWLTWQPDAKVSFTDFANVAFIPAENSYKLMLSGGKASVMVPKAALEGARTMKTEMLGNAYFHQALASLSEESEPVSLKLADGYVIRIDSAKHPDHKLPDHQ